MKTLLLTLPLLAFGQADGAKQDPSKLEEALKKDATMASVVTVTSSGDLLLFDGAITVPSSRPSVNECGEWMSLPVKDRPGQMGELRQKAEREAGGRGMSARERHLYVRKALAPKRECAARFKKKCDEIRSRVALESRKAAVADARKAIDGLLAEAKVKSRIQTYLRNVLAACPLEE